MKPNDVVTSLPDNPTQNKNAVDSAQQQEQQPGLDFVRQVITDDLAAGRTQQVVTVSRLNQMVICILVM